MTLKQLQDFANNFSEIFDRHDCKLMKKEHIEEFFKGCEQYALGLAAGKKYLEENNGGEKL